MMKHLACIMDGNRRWAKKNGVSLTEGVLQGLDRVQTAVDFCLEKNIANLSLYAFSIENLQRSVIERACYFGVMRTHGVDYAKRMKEQDVKVTLVGDRSLFPSEVVDVANEIETITGQGNRLSLQLLFCYGGRQELLAAINSIVADVQQDILQGPISEQELRTRLWMPAIPDPDLIIRTGFAQRLSNFLVYQGAYSELYFPDCLWPDMNRERFSQAYDYFMQCKRNFGA